MRCARVPRGVVMAMAMAMAIVSSSHAAKKSRDAFWVRPDFATRKVDRIALFPVVSYDSNLQSENQVEASVGAAFKSLSYRWLSGTTARDLIRSKPAGDSLLKEFRKGILAGGRLDSLQAPGLAGMLRCDAVLTLRIDQYEQHEPQWNEAGKPFTAVRLTAALVDSAGRLLWSANGDDTGEGPYHDPNANAVGVNDTGLDRKPISGQNGAPAFREVLALIAPRWAESFPKHATAAAADSAAAPH